MEKKLTIALIAVLVCLHQHALVSGGSADRNCVESLNNLQKSWYIDNKYTNEVNVMNRLTKAWISLILLASTLVINGLGAFGFFNGLSQKDVSDRYLTLITPAPFTFSIWGVIYALLISALVVMIVKNKDDYYGSAIDRSTYLFWLSCGLNMLWIISFSYTWLGLSVVLIFGFAITLSLIVKEIGKIQTGKRWLLPAAFGMYAGWLLIATVVNTAAWLVMIEWGGFGIMPEYWGIIVETVAVVLAAVITLSIKNVVFPLPIAWGYFGIYQYLMAPEGFQGQFQYLPIATLVGIVFLIGIAGFQFIKNQYRLMPDILRKEI